MDDKRFHSQVENERLPLEEPITTKGETISPEQIWRDGALIPSSPKELTFVKDPAYGESGVATDKYGTYFYEVSTFTDGETVNKLVEHIGSLLLSREDGTLNVYSNGLLKDIIGREFDADNSSEEDSWNPVITIDGNPIAYGVGHPLFDSAAGTLTFRDEQFAKDIFDEDCSNSKVYVTFYRYAGRKGFFGSNLGIDLPFRDDYALLKNAKSNKTTATFKVNGDEGNTVYVLPKAQGGYTGHDDSIEGKSGVIMLEENYNDIVWNIGVHDGGLYIDENSPQKGYGKQ